jgi:hypothetical protein
MNSNKISGRKLEEVLINLTLLWVSLMSTYFSGVVMKVISGDFLWGEIECKKISQKMGMGIVILLVIPVAIVSLCLTHVRIGSRENLQYNVSLHFRSADHNSNFSGLSSCTI